MISLSILLQTECRNSRCQTVEQRVARKLRSYPLDDPKRCSAVALTGEEEANSMAATDTQ